MDDAAPHRLRWPGVAARVGGYMLLAPVLYVLSIGPVDYVFGWRSPRLDRALMLFYSPGVGLVDRMNLLNPLDDYLIWWKALPGGSAERYLRKTPHYIPSE